MTIKEALTLHADALILLMEIFSPFRRKGGDQEGVRSWILANPAFELSKSQKTKFKKLIQKRRRGIPAAYLVGHKEFFGLDFIVNKSVLIPRPETELLVELALAPSLLQREGRGELSVIDVGTGSGNIIISLAKTLTNKSPSPLARGDASKRQGGRLDFFATDISQKALTVARGNARRHGVSRKIKFLHGNLLRPSTSSSKKILFPEQAGSGERVEGLLVLANLPYGWSQWKNNSSAETVGLNFEPQQALFTKESGLYLIRQLFEQTKKICHSGLDPESIKKGLDSRFRGNDITLLIEHDPRQKTKLNALARKYFPKSKITFHRDLASRFRVLKIKIA